MYDIQADPDEVHNLAGSPEHAEILAQMREAHREWEHEIKDVSFLPEWEMHGRSTGVDERGRVVREQRGMSPYEMGHDPLRYNFGAVFAAAEFASSLDPTSVPELVRMLDSKDDAVRYWAALGLLAHERAGVEAGIDKLYLALEDQSPVICIVAAEALGRFGDDADAKAAINTLLDFVGPESDYYVRIAAWNALDFMNEKARPALPELKEVPAKHLNLPSRVGEYVVRLKETTLQDLE